MKTKEEVLEPHKLYFAGQKEWPTEKVTYQGALEAMEEYATLRTNELQSDNTRLLGMFEKANDTSINIESENTRLREALEYSNGQIKRLVNDYPEVCYIDPLLLDCIENADKALNK